MATGEQALNAGVAADFFSKEDMDRQEALNYRDTTCPDCGGLARAQSPVRITRDGETWEEVVVTCRAGCRVESKRRGRLGGKYRKKTWHHRVEGPPLPPPPPPIAPAPKSEIKEPAPPIRPATPEEFHESYKFETWGAWVCELIRRTGLDRDAIAKALDTTRARLDLIVRDSITMQPQWWAPLCEVLGVSLEHLKGVFVWPESELPDQPNLSGTLTDKLRPEPLDTTTQPEPRKEPTMTKTCDQCAAEFEPRTSRGRFCSRKCGQKFNNAKRDRRKDTNKPPRKKPQKPAPLPPAPNLTELREKTAPAPATQELTLDQFLDQADPLALAERVLARLPRAAREQVVTLVNLREDVKAQL